jgi:hypothetical protein
MQHIVSLSLPTIASFSIILSQDKKIGALRYAITHHPT